MNYKLILVIVCCLILSCSESQRIEQTVIIVKVPPIYDDQLSQEENFWRFQHFLFPQIEIPNPISKGLPNDDSLLFVSLEETGKLKLNSEEEGEISDTSHLEKRLRMVFQEREMNGVYEPGNWKVVKAVGIGAANSTRYGDLMKLIDTVKQSGADPIVLLFENDARPKLIINLSTNTKLKE